MSMKSVDRRGRPADAIYKNRDWLFQEYITKNRSEQSIADGCGVKGNTLLYWLRKFNIPTRRRALDNPQDIIGQVFGDLRVLSLLKTTWTGRGPHRRRNYLYQCLCSCGQTVERNRNALVTRHVKSCGCRWGRMRRKAPGEANFNNILSTYQKKARERNLAWELSPEQFRILLQGECFYCHRPPSNCKSSASHNGAYVYNGIDRQDNKAGYLPSNCVSSCARCNTMKSNLSVGEFVQHISDIYRVQNEHKIG